MLEAPARLYKNAYSGIPMFRFENPPPELTHSGCWVVNTREGVTAVYAEAVVPVDDSPEMSAWCEYDQEEDT